MRAGDISFYNFEKFWATLTYTYGLGLTQLKKIALCDKLTDKCKTNLSLEQEPLLKIGRKKHFNANYKKE